MTCDREICGPGIGAREICGLICDREKIGNREQFAVEDIWTVTASIELIKHIHADTCV